MPETIEITDEVLKRWRKEYLERRFNSQPFIEKFVPLVIQYLNLYSTEVKEISQEIDALIGIGNWNEEALNNILGHRLKKKDFSTAREAIVLYRFARKRQAI